MSKSNTMLQMPSAAIGMMRDGVKMEKGVDARFFRINKHWGFKFFDSQRYAKLTHQLQQQAHARGLAPEVGQLYSFPCPNSQCMVYGYLTECIEETLYDFWMRVGKITRCDSYWDWQNEVEEMYDWQMLDKFCRELNPNCCCTDLHWANIGYLRGVLVAIDFSGLIYGMD